MSKKRILITGTSSGIGKALLYHLSNCGYACDVVNRVQTPYQGIYHAYRCDLSNREAVDQLCEQLVTQTYFGLINNAGWGEPTPFESLHSKCIQQELQLNLITPLMLMKAVVPGMRQCGVGRIINISSIAATQPVSWLMAYGAGKAGLHALTQSVASYLLGCNITVNTLALGGINTKRAVQGRKKISRLSGQKQSDYQAQMIHRMGTKCLLEPDALLGIVHSIFDDQVGAINGQRFNICGLLAMH